MLSARWLRLCERVEEGYDFHRGSDAGVPVNFLGGGARHTDATVGGGVSGKVPDMETHAVARQPHPIRHGRGHGPTAFGDGIRAEVRGAFGDLAFCVVDFPVEVGIVFFAFLENFVGAFWGGVAFPSRGDGEIDGDAFACEEDGALVLERNDDAGVRGGDGGEGIGVLVNFVFPAGFGTECGVAGGGIFP